MNWKYNRQIDKQLDDWTVSVGVPIVKNIGKIL